MAQPPGNTPTLSPPASPGSPSQVSSRAALIIGFVVGGAALVALAEVMPEAAIGLTAILGLGVVLMHPQEINALSTAFVHATGH